jgi:hypothetical protein
MYKIVDDKGDEVMIINDKYYDFISECSYVNALYNFQKCTKAEVLKNELIDKLDKLLQEDIHY